MWDSVRDAGLLFALPLFVILLYALFVSVSVLAARFERAPIAEWAALDGSVPAPALSAYHAEMDRQAALLGFQRQGLHRHTTRQLSS